VVNASFFTHSIVPQGTFAAHPKSQTPDAINRQLRHTYANGVQLERGYADLSGRSDAGTGPLNENVSMHTASAFAGTRCSDGS
jgi:hypothetical protein